MGFFKKIKKSIIKRKEERQKRKRQIENLLGDYVVAEEKDEMLERFVDLAETYPEVEEKIQKIVTNVIRKMPTIHSTITLTRSENEQLFQTSEKLIGFHAWSKQCSSIRCYS